jgi:hypothetical protein
MVTNKPTGRPGDPQTKPDNAQPEERPRPFAEGPSRRPPTKEQRERDGKETDDDDKMDAVIRDTPL